MDHRPLEYRFELIGVAHSCGRKFMIMLRRCWLILNGRLGMLVW